MATAAPNLPSNAPRGPDRPGVPIRTSSTNYVTAQRKASLASSTDGINEPPSSPTSTVRIPDGRKNSVGEILSSPAEDWKPDFKRKQSYKQEDLKREMQMAGIVTDAGEARKDGDGQGRGGGVGKAGEGGFTEV